MHGQIDVPRGEQLPVVAGHGNRHLLLRVLRVHPIVVEIRPTPSLIGWVRLLRESPRSVMLVVEERRVRQQHLLATSSKIELISDRLRSES